MKLVPVIEMAPNVHKLFIFTDQVQVYMARLTSMEVEKKYDALTEERASEVLELCDFVLDKIKVSEIIYIQHLA